MVESVVETVVESVAAPVAAVEALPAVVATAVEETYASLRAKARELRIPNYSRMSKAELQRRLAERG